MTETLNQLQISALYWPTGVLTLVYNEGNEKYMGFYMKNTNSANAIILLRVLILSKIFLSYVVNVGLTYYASGHGKSKSKHHNLT
jgi:hypothetical protein